MIGFMTIALLLAAQDPDWNCENPQAQQEMNYCAGQDAEQADAELNAAFRAAIEQAREADREYARLTEGRSDGDPGEEATLREAQRAWLSFRGAQCRMESYEARGGSMQPMLDSGCRAGLTRARAAALRGPNPECPGGAMRDEHVRCLTGLLARADAALSRQWQEVLSARPRGDRSVTTRMVNTQRAWLTYRDGHCDGVASPELGEEIATEQSLLCRIALTEARLHEVADIAIVEPQ